MIPRRGAATISLLLSAVLLVLLLAEPAGAQPSGDAPRKRLHAWPFAELYEWPDGRREFECFFSAYRSLEGPGVRQTRLFPFYWSGRSTADSSSYDLLLPLYWHERSGEFETLWTPAYYSSRSIDGFSVRRFAPGLLPLYSGRRTGAFSSDLVGVPYAFSFWGSSRQPGRRDTSALALVPGSEPGRERLSLFHLREKTDARSPSLATHLFPLYSYKRRGPAEAPVRSELFLPPLLTYWKRDEGNSLFISLPLLGGSKYTPNSSSHVGLLGLAGTQRVNESSGVLRSYWFEPLFARWRGPDKRGYHIAHIYGQSTDAAAGTRSYHFLDPLGRTDFRGEEVVHSRLLPFYLYDRSGSVAWHWAALLYLRRKDAAAGTTFESFFPFYFRNDSPATRERLWLPFYASRTNEASELRWAALLYFSRTSRPGPEQPEPESFTTLFPIYWSSIHGEQRLRMLLPAYLSSEDGARSLELFGGPLYVRSASGAADGARSHSILWPIFSYSESNTGWHLRIPPIVWITRGEELDLDVYFPFFARVATPTKSSRWVVPLWGTYERREPDGSRVDLSFYALGAWVRGVGTSPAGERWRDDVHILGPLAGWARDDRTGRRHSRFLPFWYSYSSGDTAMKTLFPAYFSYAQGDRSWRSAALLYFDAHERTPAGDASFRLLFPAWCSMRGPGLERDLVLGPLYVRERSGPDMSKRSDSVLMPFFMRTVDRDKSALRLNPFFALRERAGETRSVRLSPLFYYKRYAEDPSFGGSLHLFHHQTGSNGTSRTGMFPLFQIDRGPGGRQVSLPLLLSYSAQFGSSHETRVALFEFERDSDTGHTRFSIDPFGSSTWMPDQGRVRHKWLASAIVFDSMEGRTKQRLFPLWKYHDVAGGRFQLQLSPLVSYQRYARGRVAGGPLSSDGFLGLQLARATYGDDSSTLCLNPFLFGYHESADRWEFHTLFGAATGSGAPGRERFQCLQFVRYRSSRHYSRWCALPLIYSEEWRAGAPGGIRPAEFLNFYYLGEDAKSSRWRFAGILANGERSKVNDDYDYRVLYRFAQATRRGSYSEYSLRPFFTNEQDARTGYSYFSLGSFIYRSERENAGAPVKRRILGFIPI